MDQRDQELLDKQLWGVSPRPPGKGGVLGLAFVAVFLIGLSIGGSFFTHKSSQTASRDATIAISLLNNSSGNSSPHMP
jgi:hypothetical protein